MVPGPTIMNRGAHVVIKQARRRRLLVFVLGGIDISSRWVTRVRGGGGGGGGKQCRATRALGETLHAARYGTFSRFPQVLCVKNERSGEREEDKGVGAPIAAKSVPNCTDVLYINISLKLSSNEDLGAGW